MKTYFDTFSQKELPVYQQQFFSSDMLLFDIETTGLSPASAWIYCIGCGYLHGDQITAELFFAESADEESLILQKFAGLCRQFQTVITFNGTTFDIPFIKKRLKEDLLVDMTSIDLYREVRRLNGLLRLPSCKQKSVEQFLGCCREDKFTGGQLIDIYLDYVKHPDEQALHLLLLHNLEDVKGMFALLGILAYSQLSDGSFDIGKITPESDHGKDSLCISLHFPLPLPQSISLLNEHASVLIEENTALLRFPVQHGTLLHFFPDPENYYYLPKEDTAIHKSVGIYVDPSHRVKAAKKNCYVKKECDYLQIPAPPGDDFFRPEGLTNCSCLPLPVSDSEALKKFLQKFFHIYIR